jgi:hypothetical protein
MPTREIISVQTNGTSGIHQFGFTRFAKVTMDCGHSVRVEYLLPGDSNGYRLCTQSELPVVGTVRHCPKCRKESTTSRSPRTDALALARDPARSQWDIFAIQALLDGKSSFVTLERRDALLSEWSHPHA